MYLSSFVSRTAATSLRPSTADSIRWNYDALMFVVREVTSRHEFVCELESSFAASEKKLASLLEEHTADAYFEEVNRIAVGAAQKFFTKDRSDDKRGEARKERMAL